MSGVLILIERNGNSVWPYRRRIANYRFNCASTVSSNLATMHIGVPTKSAMSYFIAKPDNSYSLRSAAIGSSRAARRAGR